MKLKEAKRLYLEMDCSVYKMADYDREKFHAYMNMKIPELLEKRWRIIKLKEISESIDNCNVDISLLISKMADIAESIENKHSLKIVYDSIMDVYSRFSVLDKHYRIGKYSGKVIFART